MGNALIVGGASGIGNSIAKLLSSHGVNCTVWDKASMTIEDLERHPNITYDFIDVTNNNSIISAVKKLQERVNGINQLVYSVGILGKKGNLWECNNDDWEQVIDTNLSGCFRIMKACIPLMFDQSDARIVNVASVSGKDGSIHASHYSSSKAGVIALTKSLSKELAKQGILVNCVTPSATKTAFLKREPEEDVKRQIEKIYLGRAADPEEIAELIMFLLSPKCSFTTGAIIDASGGRSVY